MPKVSIIIPTYNVEQYLEQCMDSIISQTLKDIEIICVDDGSTDSSGKILDDYAARDNRIKVIHKENGGYGKAMNIGLDNATGEYIGIVEPDDWVELNMCEDFAYLMDEYNLDFVKGNHYRYSIQNNSSKNEICVPFDKSQIYNNIIKPIDYKETFKGTCAIWAGLYSNSFLKKHNIRFLETAGASYQDTGFWIQVLLEAEKSLFIEKAYYHYRTDNENSSMNSTGKIYCICDEMHNLENRYNSDKSKLHIVNSVKIDKYIWNYKRLNNKGKKIFLKIFIQELKPLYKNKKYNKELLSDKLKQIYVDILYKGNPYHSFIEKIFSVKNDKEKAHKILTILGFKFKYKTKSLIIKSKIDKLNSNCKKSSKLIKKLRTEKQVNEIALYEYMNYRENNFRENSILMVEINPYHGECMPGIAKYFIDLGYNIDVILSKSEYNLNPFSDLKDSKINIYNLSAQGAKLILNSNIAKKYEYIYINSDKIGKSGAQSMEFFNNIPIEKRRIINLSHRLDELDIELYKDVNIITLAKFKNSNNNIKTVNAHYFGEFEKHQKNYITNFIVVGNIEKQRKNFDLLLDTIENLHNNGIRNFKITVIARIGAIKNIKPEIKQYINFLGSMSYENMYKELNNADFFLTLLDPTNPAHERYISTGTSGSFQLIYGFRLPCLIPEKFALHYRFNSLNSIVYKSNNDLLSAMNYAVNMSEDEYTQMQDQLTVTANDIYEESLNNLKEITEKCHEDNCILCV